MQKISDVTNKMSKILLTNLVGVMSLVLIIQVICRTFFGFSIFWSEELARYCLVWITFIGASIALKNVELANLDILVEKISKNFRWIALLIIEGLVLCFIILAIIYGFKQTFSTGSLSQVSPAMQLPMWVVNISVPIGFGVMLIHTLTSLMNLITNREVEKEC